MREHMPKIVIVALLLAVVGTPFVLRTFGFAETKAAINAAPDDRLIIYSPHNEQIRDELTRGFNAYRAAQGETPVEMEWRTSGGTSDLRRGILSQYDAVAARGSIDDGIGADLFFGGGEYDHGKLASGIVAGDEAEMQPVAAVPNLPQGLLDEVFPSREIGGAALVHRDELWTGTALSSFGIVYNFDLLAMLNIEAPTTWDDLTDPRYANWIAMADPGHSGSISAALETVLRRQGWTDGWKTLRRIYANSRYFSASATKVPLDVSSGDAAAGMAIDFYGRFQAGATINDDGSPRVGYADPAVAGVSQTATTADPITLLRGAPHREIAEQFIAWVLSKDAQRLWQRKLDSEGGPAVYELRRQPIRRDLFTTDEKQHWTDPQLDPFAQALPFPEPMPGFFSMVAPVTHAIAVDIHHDLKTAWHTICATPDSHPNKDEMLALFDAMPDDLTLTWPDEDLANHWAKIIRDPKHKRYEEAAQVLSDFSDNLGGRSRDEVLNDRLRWTEFFGDNYRKIVELAD